MHKVLLTDTMQEVLDDLVFALGDHFETEICSCGAQLQAAVERFAPDILLLDLAMPGYDPIRFLQGLPEKKPLIVATTFVTNDHLLCLLEEYQVKSVVIKPLNADGMAAALLRWEQTLCAQAQSRAAVYEALLAAGAKLRYTGFTPLAEGIVYACDHVHCSVTDEVYPYVARVCGSTHQAVEKAISRCIRRTYTCADRALWLQMFGQKDCPSNGIFIRQMAHAVLQREKKP